MEVDKDAMEVGRLCAEGIPSHTTRDRLELFFTKITRGADITHVYYPLPQKPHTAVVEFTDVTVVTSLLQDQEHATVEFRDGALNETLHLSQYKGPKNPLLVLELDSFAIGGMEIQGQDDIDRIVEILQKPYIGFKMEMEFLNLEEVVSKELRDGKITPSKMVPNTGSGAVKLDFSILHKAVFDKLEQCNVSKVKKMFFPTDVKYSIPDAPFDPEGQARLYQFSPRYMPQSQKVEAYQQHVVDMMSELPDEMIGHLKLIHLSHKTSFQDLSNILSKVQKVRDKTSLNGSLMLYVEQLDFMSKVAELPTLENVTIYTEKHDIFYIPSAMDTRLKEQATADNLFQAGMRILCKGSAKILSSIVICNNEQLSREQKNILCSVKADRMSVKQNLNTPPASPSPALLYQAQFSFEEWPKMRRMSSIDTAVIAEKRKRQRIGLSDAFTSISDPVFVNYSLKFACITKCINALKKLYAIEGLEQSHVTVGVLDTGVSVFHKAFSQSQILAVQSFVPGDNLDAVWDVNGQGTHCCGILAGDSYEAQLPCDAELLDEPQKFTNGVAPFVNLVVAKVLDRATNGSADSIAEGIEWMLQLEDHDPQYKIDIISISAGDFRFSQRLRTAVSMATIKGKIIISASSNDEQSHQTGIVYPARFADVISVGSHNARGQVSRFTPLGREMDFLAPGDDIWSASPVSSTSVQRMSGTAMATPFVAGITAIVLSYAEAVGGEELRATVCNNAVMREILRVMSSCPGHHSEAYGYGSLNPWRIFEYGQDYFKNVITKIVHGEVS